MQGFCDRLQDMRWQHQHQHQHCSRPSGDCQAVHADWGAAVGLSDSAASFLGCARPAAEQQQQRVLRVPEGLLPAHALAAGGSSGATAAGAAGGGAAAAGCCAGCAALSEALLEAEFLRELSTAQLGVVLEERNLLAQQHESLVQLLADSNMSGCLRQGVSDHD